MYKESVKIRSFDGEIETVNIETVGKYADSYKWYFDCSICKNQSIADDEGTIYSCNNCSTLSDITDSKMYCRNYVKDFEYCKKYGQRYR